MEILLLLPLLVFSLLLLLSKPRPKQGFPNLPLLGTLPSFVLNRHRFLDWTAAVLRRSPTHTAFFSRPGGVHGILTANPANVQYMLKTNFDNYPKGPRFIALLEDFLGKGIFNSDGELWKVQRKTASYEFSTKSMRSFGMETAAEEVRGRLVPVLGRATESGRVLDLQDVLERFAFDNICKKLVNELVAVDLRLGDEVQARLLLSSLPDSWEKLVVFLSNSAPNGLIIEMVKDALFSEKNKRKELESNHFDAFVTKGKQQDNGRGRNKNGGRGSNKKCYYCCKIGHIKKNCWKRKHDQGESSKKSTDEDGFTLVTISGVVPDN